MRCVTWWLLHWPHDHTTGLLPDQLKLTYVAAGHCLYPLPSIFFSFYILSNSLPIFSPYRYQVVHVSSTLGNVHWDRLLTQRISSATILESLTAAFGPQRAGDNFKLLLISSHFFKSILMTQHVPFYYEYMHSWLRKLHATKDNVFNIKGDCIDFTHEV